MAKAQDPPCSEEPQEPDLGRASVTAAPAWDERAQVGTPPQGICSCANVPNRGNLVTNQPTPLLTYYKGSSTSVCWKNSVRCFSKASLSWNYWSWLSPRYAVPHRWLCSPSSPGGEFSYKQHLRVLLLERTKYLTSISTELLLFAYGKAFLTQQIKYQKVDLEKGNTFCGIPFAPRWDDNSQGCEVPRQHTGVFLWGVKLALLYHR